MGEDGKDSVSEVEGKAIGLSSRSSSSSSELTADKSLAHTAVTGEPVNVER